MVNLFGGAVAPLGLPLLIGLVSRRVTPRSVAQAVLVGVSMAPLLYIFLPASMPILGINFEQEVIIFAVSFLMVMAITFGWSALQPMTVAEAERAEVFHRRLETPIGGLPEDQGVEQREEAFSRFRVVGICVMCIGALMLCVQPWIHERLLVILNVVLACVLVAIGALMYWASARRAVSPSKCPPGNYLLAITGRQPVPQRDGSTSPRVAQCRAILPRA